MPIGRRTRTVITASRSERESATQSIYGVLTSGLGRFARQEEAIFPENFSRFGLLNISEKALGNGPCGFQKDHALPKWRMPFLRDQHEAPRRRETGNQCNGIGDDAALSIARKNKLGSLRHILPVNQLRLDLVPQATVLQCFHCALSVRSMLRVGDGKADDPAVIDRLGKIVERRIRLEL